MEKYIRFRPKTHEKRGMNPIWRGIGCLLLIISLLSSYFIMRLILPALIGTGLVPSQLLGHILLPAWAFKFQVTATVARFIYGFDNLWIQLIIFFVVLLLLTFLGTMIYMSIYHFIGPPRYSKTDAPPSKHKPKPYRR